MLTQNNYVLTHLEKMGSITPQEALEKYGIMRLASRISDLRRAGYRIGKVMEKGKNRFDQPTMYARYYLIKEDEQNVECDSAAGTAC